MTCKTDNIGGGSDGGGLTARFMQHKPCSIRAILRKTGYSYSVTRGTLSMSWIG
jgi:hypothetical protein